MQLILWFRLTIIALLTEPYVISKSWVAVPVFLFILISAFSGYDPWNTIFFSDRADPGTRKSVTSFSAGFV